MLGISIGIACFVELKREAHEAHEAHEAVVLVATLSGKAALHMAKPSASTKRRFR